LAYEGHKVLSDVCFEVESGEYLCICGENGSGKSTLLKGILGLKTPSEGKIEYPDGLKQKEIGYLPQQTEMRKDFPAGVMEVVLTGCLNGGWRPFYSKKDKTRAKENMELMGVLPLSKRSFSELSGGQQRRVLLARALCAAKRLLILDEPVSGLDSAASEEFYNALDRLHKERKMTIIMVTHDLKNAFLHADKILKLGDTPPTYLTAYKTAEGRQHV
jgi:zinc transport system ATP-binding protein